MDLRSEDVKANSFNISNRNKNNADSNTVNYNSNALGILKPGSKRNGLQKIAAGQSINRSCFNC